MDYNFDTLAQETIDLTKQFDDKFPRKFDGVQLDWLSENEIELEIIDEHHEVASFKENQEYLEPQGPGLAFRIEKGTQTFCIRAALIDKIEYLARDLEQGDRRLYQSLRIEDLKQLREVYTFETETLELAEVIIDQFCNRRFPYQEQGLFNLSDPGFSWWFEEKLGSFQITFQSPGLNNRYHSLGPLGDTMIATKRFNAIFKNLAEFNSFEEIVATPRSISIRHGQKIPEAFNLLKDLLMEGREIADILKFEKSFQDSRDFKTSLFYLKELAYLRQFWLSIEERL